MLERHCGKCGLAKDLDQFWKGSGRDGLDYYCKPCRNDASTASRHRKTSDLTLLKAGRPEIAPGSDRVCSICNETKPLEDFKKKYKNRTGSSAWSYRCRRCDNRHKKANRKPEPGNRRRLLRQYNLTPSDYEAMLTSQGGVCAICGESPKARHLSVDHCHTTGVVRGLLCNPCNLSLGNLRDRPDLFENAIDYLRSHSPVGV